MGTTDVPPPEDLDLRQIDHAYAYVPAASAPTPPVSPEGTIRICSWNVERFAKQHVATQIAVMAKVLRQCDLAAIEEIKDPVDSIRLRFRLEQVTKVDWGGRSGRSGEPGFMSTSPCVS